MIFTGKAFNGAKVQFNTETLEFTGTLTENGIRNLADKLEKYYCKEGLAKGFLKAFEIADCNTMKKRLSAFKAVTTISKKFEYDFISLCYELFPFLSSLEFRTSKFYKTMELYKEVLEIDKGLIPPINIAYDLGWISYSDYLEFIVKNKEYSSWFKNYGSLIFLMGADEIKMVLTYFNSPEHLANYCDSLLENEFLEDDELRKITEYPSLYKSVHGYLPKRFPREILSEFEKLKRTEC